MLRLCFVRRNYTRLLRLCLDLLVFQRLSDEKWIFQRLFGKKLRSQHFRGSITSHVRECGCVRLRACACVRACVCVHMYACFRGARARDRVFGKRKRNGAGIYITYLYTLGSSTDLGAWSSARCPKGLRVVGRASGRMRLTHILCLLRPGSLGARSRTIGGLYIKAWMC